MGVLDVVKLWISHLCSRPVSLFSTALLHNLFINPAESLFAALGETKGFCVSAALLQSATSKESSWPRTEGLLG